MDGDTSKVGTNYINALPFTDPFLDPRSRYPCSLVVRGNPDQYCRKYWSFGANGNYPNVFQDESHYQWPSTFDSGFDCGFLRMVVSLKRPWFMINCFKYCKLCQMLDHEQKDCPSNPRSRDESPDQSKRPPPNEEERAKNHHRREVNRREFSSSRSNYQKGARIFSGPGSWGSSSFSQIVSRTLQRASR